MALLAHEGQGPSGGEPRDLGVLAASTDVFALDRAIVDILQVDPAQVPTILASETLGVCPSLDQINFPLEQPQSLRIDGWKLPDTIMPIDFGLPRVLKSTFRHLYIRFIKEPMGAYANR